jgi:acyl-CoA synthetase (NDP forming)
MDAGSRPDPWPVRSLMQAASIVVVGASGDASKPAGRPLRLLRRDGYSGVVHCVNPRYKEVLGYPCWPTVDDVPGPVDVALILLPASQAAEAVKACGRLGVRVAVVIASGFAETGDDARQAALRSAAEFANIRLIGPNSVGAVVPAIGLTATFASAVARWPVPDGSIALVSQSGALGSAVVEECRTRGVGMRAWVSTGNELDVGALDCTEYFLRDSDCKAVALIVEGFQRGPNLISLGRLADSVGKAVVVLRTTRSEYGRRAAVSHTGKMAGSGAVWVGVSRQAGIIDVQSPDELTDICAMLDCGLRPEHARGVAILSASGGLGTFIADQCGLAGLPLAQLQPGTVNALSTMLPAQQATLNPIDTGYFANPAEFVRCLELACSDRGVSTAIVVLDPFNHDYDVVAPELSRLAQQVSPTKIVVTFTFPTLDMSTEMRSDLHKSGVVVAPTATRAVNALRHFAGAEHLPVTGHAGSPADSEAAEPGQLDFAKQIALLEAAGFALPRQRLCETSAAAAAAAAEIGFPVAVKLLVPGSLHKTEIGGVRLRLTSKRQVLEAVRRMRAAQSVRRGLTGTEESVLLVQEFVGGGAEVALGAFVDREFGAIMMVARGGVETELFDDSSFRSVPVNEEDVTAMLAELKMTPLLTGFRGQPRLDIAALKDCALKFAHFVGQHMPCMFVEVDLNPVKVLEEGQGVRVLDFSFRSVPGSVSA